MKPFPVSTGDLALFRNKDSNWIVDRFDYIGTDGGDAFEPQGGGIYDYVAPISCLDDIDDNINTNRRLKNQVYVYDRNNYDCSNIWFVG